MNHGKTSSAKRNSGKKSALTERGHRTLRSCVSKNHKTTAEQVTAELNMKTISTKTVLPELYKSNIHGRAAIDKSLVTENNAQIRR
jgi:hypothetical protein